MKISLGTLKEKGEDLAGFLEPRVGTKPELSGDSIEIDDGALRAGVKPRQVKTYIKRFMYIKGLRKNYRVFVAGRELTIQEIQLKEEKEKEKKAKPEESGPEAPEAAREEPSEPEMEKKAEVPKAKKPKKAPRKPRTKKKESA